MIVSISRIYAVLYRNFCADKRSIMRLTDMVYYPAIDITLWGMTSRWLQNEQTTNSLIALGTSLVLWQVVSRCILDLSIGMVEELWNRSITNFFGSPLRLGEWMIANMFTGIIKILFILPYAASLVWLVYGINIFNIGWMIAIYIMLLLCIGWAIGFVGSSIILHWGRQAQSTPWMISWFFTPICAIFYPLATLPTAVQKVSVCIPLTHIFEAVRTHIFTGVIDWEHLGIGAVLTLVYLGLSMLLFRRMFARALKRGLASLE